MLIERNHLLIIVCVAEEGGVTKMTIWKRVWKEYVHNYVVLSMCNLDSQYANYTFIQK